MYTDAMVKDASQFDDLFDKILELNPKIGLQSYSKDMNLLNGMNENKGISGSFTFYNDDRTEFMQLSIDSLLKKNDISFCGHICYGQNNEQKFYKYIIEYSGAKYKKALSKAIDQLLDRRDIDPYFIPILNYINDLL